MIAKIAMAVCLSFLAGFVDALGFMQLGGYFVSFMTGNSTQMAAAMPDGLSGAILPASLIGLFVLGVILGTIMGQRLPTAFGLSALAFLLALAAVFSLVKMDDVAILVTPVVMGAMNTVITTNQGGMAVTFMTGNLVKLGQALVQAFQGNSRWGWLPFLLLWLGLLSGVFSGVISYEEMGLNSLWVPVAGLIALAVTTTLSRKWIAPRRAGGS